MIITAETISEASLGDQANTLVDDYHVALRQMRATEVFFNRSLDILNGVAVDLDGSFTVLPINQAVAWAISEHLDIVNTRATSKNSITNKSVGQQQKARDEHNNQGYNFDSSVAALNGEMQSTKSIAIGAITPVYSPESLLNNGRITSLRNRINALLADYL